MTPEESLSYILKAHLSFSSDEFASDTIVASINSETHMDNCNMKLWGGGGGGRGHLKVKSAIIVCIKFWKNLIHKDGRLLKS